MIIILLISNVAIYFIVKPKSTEDLGVIYRAKYPLLDGNRRLAKLDDLIVNVQPLRVYLKSLPESNKDWADMSIYFEVMNTGANVTVNPDLELWPASLAKLPLAMIIIKKIENGDLNFSTMITLTKEDADIVRTPDIAQDIGRQYDISFLLDRLLIESDNTAYRMLFRQVNKEEINSIGEAVGVEEFFKEGGEVTAKEYSRLFRALYLATYLNEDNSQYLLQLMQSSDYNQMLKAGLPEKVKFAHKWGTNIAINTYADSGIVYFDNRPYLLSVMIRTKNGSGQVEQDKVQKLMKEISQNTYDYVAKK